MTRIGKKQQEIVDYMLQGHKLIYNTRFGGSWRLSGGAYVEVPKQRANGLRNKGVVIWDKEASTLDDKVYKLSEDWL